MIPKCLSCALIRNELKWELIYNGKYFEVRPDFVVPIPGFFVISSKRHIIGFADLKIQEQEELIKLICKIRRFLKEKMKIKYVTYLCREENISSKRYPSHFHFALLPKLSWMKKYKTTEEVLTYGSKIRNPDNFKGVEKVNKALKDYLL